MQIVSSIALISINETLIIQVISFLILLFVMNRIMFRPLRRTIEERKRYVEEVSQEINNAIGDVERYTTEMEDRRLVIRSEAFKATSESENIGNQEAAKIVDAAVREISMIREKTREEVDAQISEARKHIRKESEAIAQHIMEKVLERRLST